jgi:DNA-binding NarL/FixJ family response regulator
MSVALSDEMRPSRVNTSEVWSAVDADAVVCGPREARGAPAEHAERAGEETKIVIIDDRILLRECFARSIEAAREMTSALCFSTVKEWQAVADEQSSVSLILLCCSSRTIAASNADIELLVKSAGGTPVVLVCDEEDYEVIQKALKHGARGFIPASVNLQLAVMAMHLVTAGGVYLPESILNASKTVTPEADTAAKPPLHGLLTERQAAVVDELRQGKPNKIIAYDLKMQESTVKVHIRNVMKKLNAKNRTEVAFIINNLIQGAAT